jgi:hypothetical protein
MKKRNKIYFNNKQKEKETYRNVSNFFSVLKEYDMMYIMFPLFNKLAKVKNIVDKNGDVINFKSEKHNHERTITTSTEY